ncbi:hypothetical protein EDC01DRAFT_732723 [Geopyxis carbonaria]|nr:hypothetical protein EDC01DRAFT_732723 [Geopyxis carbonaria]
MPETTATTKVSQEGKGKMIAAALGKTEIYNDHHEKSIERSSVQSSTSSEIPQSAIEQQQIKQKMKSQETLLSSKNKNKTKQPLTVETLLKQEDQGKLGGHKTSDFSELPVIQTKKRGTQSHTGWQKATLSTSQQLTGTNHAYSRPQSPLSLLHVTFQQAEQTQQPIYVEQVQIDVDQEKLDLEEERIKKLLDSALCRTVHERVMPGFDLGYRHILLKFCTSPELPYPYIRGYEWTRHHLDPSEDWSLCYRFPYEESKITLEDCSEWWLNHEEENVQQHLPKHIRKQEFRDRDVESKFETWSALKTVEAEYSQNISTCPSAPLTLQTDTCHAHETLNSRTARSIGVNIVPQATTTRGRIFTSGHHQVNQETPQKNLEQDFQVDYTLYFPGLAFILLLGSCWYLGFFKRPHVNDRKSDKRSNQIVSDSTDSKSEDEPPTPQESKSDSESNDGSSTSHEPTSDPESEYESSPPQEPKSDSESKDGYSPSEESKSGGNLMIQKSMKTASEVPDEQDLQKESHTSRIDSSLNECLLAQTSSSPSGSIDTSTKEQGHLELKSDPYHESHIPGDSPSFQASKSSSSSNPSDTSLVEQPRTPSTDLLKGSKKLHQRTRADAVITDPPQPHQTSSNFPPQPRSMSPASTAYGDGTEPDVVKPPIFPETREEIKNILNVGLPVRQTMSRAEEETQEETPNVPQGTTVVTEGIISDTSVQNSAANMTTENVTRRKRVHFADN